MPAGFRKDNSAAILEDDFYLTPHKDGYLIVRPKIIWDEYIRSIEEDSKLSPYEKRRFIEDLHTFSDHIKLDRQHRIVLKEGMRNKLRTPGSESRQSLTIIGCGRHFEIWPEHSRKSEEEYITELSEKIDRFAGKKE